MAELRALRPSRRLIANLLGLALLLMLVACGKPPLRMSVTDDTIRFSVETLGEYPTTIRHALLEQVDTHAVIWEIKAKSGTPQIHTLVFRKGDNRAALADPTTGDYEVLRPSTSDVFSLKTGVTYQLRVWKELDSSPAKATFQIQ